MKRVAVFLEAGQLRKLKALAKKQDKPWARVLRRAVDFYFEAIEREEPELLNESEATPTQPIRQISAEQFRQLRHRARGKR